MKLHRTPAFLRAYRFLPHRLLNRAAARITASRHPRVLIDAAIKLWIRRGAIDMSQFENRPFATIDDFFLRRLRAGARPLGPGFISPVDGILMATGPIHKNLRLPIKGRDLSLSRLVHGSDEGQLSDYEGGTFAALFLTPDGYHHIHMPAAGTIESSRFIPGRFHPQNEDALLHLDRVYEKNERLVLRCALSEGLECLLVLVGASLIGGIELKGVPRSAWAKPGAIRPLSLARDKGDEIGHFRFGSTVVVLLPRCANLHCALPPGARVKMGETLLSLNDQ